jgi:hypothetical protein
VKHELRWAYCLGDLSTGSGSGSGSGGGRMLLRKRVPPLARRVLVTTRYWLDVPKGE